MKRARVTEVSTPAKRRSTKKASSATALVDRRLFRALPLSKNVGKYKTGFPKQMFMRHKFMQNASVSAATGNLGTFSIGTNALFDPDNSGATTHQPMYFDQVAALYNKYCVMASKCTFTFYVTTGTTPVMIVAYIEDDTTVTPTSAVALAEQASAHFRCLPQTSTFEAFQQTNQITLKWDAKKAFGGDVIDNSALTAATTANPTEQQLFMFAVQDASPTPAANVTVHVNVIVEYTVQWFELRNIEGS